MSLADEERAALEGLLKKGTVAAGKIAHARSLLLADAEVAGWENKRNTKQLRVHWTFTLAVARQKLRELSPTIEA